MQSFTTLIPAAALAPHLADPGWRIVDVRHDLMDPQAGPRAYAAGHIPGAVFASIDDDLSGIKTGRNGRHPLPERAGLVRRFRAWGIDNGTQLVAYDAQGGQFAVRLWWLARWLGHSKVALLDGGWPAWLAHGGASTAAVPTPPAGSFEPGNSLVRIATADDVLASRGQRDTLLVDVRAPERYEGKSEPIDPVAGHIPGAVNRFWQSNLGADSRFKSPSQLRSELTQLLNGRTPENVIAQCGSGVTGCHLLLAMEVAGLPGGALYAGSWSEWIADPSRPVAVGTS
jgi:thiosulfate/3-mercaptopyruvate sulfurtransferase